MLFICQLCNARLWLGFPHLHLGQLRLPFGEGFLCLSQEEILFFPFNGFNLPVTPRSQRNLLPIQSLAISFHHYRSHF